MKRTFSRSRLRSRLNALRSLARPWPACDGWDELEPGSACLLVSIAGFMATPRRQRRCHVGCPLDALRHTRLTTEQETSSEANSGHPARLPASCRPPVRARNSANVAISRSRASPIRRNDAPHTGSPAPGYARAHHARDHGNGRHSGGPVFRRYCAAALSRPPRRSCSAFRCASPLRAAWMTLTRFGRHVGRGGDRGGDRGEVR